MKQLINLLILLAVVSFGFGFVGRLFNTNIVWEPVIFWRGAMLFLTFAIALILIQIRDK